MANLAKCRHLLEDPVVVSLAIFFHDVVYNPKSRSAIFFHASSFSRLDFSSNEADSAALFQDFAKTLNLGAKADTISAFITRTGSSITHFHTARMRFAAANHLSGPASGDLAFFLDIDLAILGSDPISYAKYAEGTPWARFNMGQRKVSSWFHYVPSF